MASTRNGSRRTTQRARKAVGKSTAGERLPSVEQMLEDYDEVFLQCRDLRHPWSVVGYYREGAFIRRWLTCERCGCRRTDTWSRHGGRVTSSLDYPDGYVLPGSGGAAKGDTLRAAVLSRVVIWGNETEMMDSLFSKSSRRRAAR